MATVNEKMTALANAIRSKTGGTSALTLDGMISAVNGITTGGGSSGYTLWGDQSLKPNAIDVSSYVGTYNVSGINAYFYDAYGTGTWLWDDVSTIEVTQHGNIYIRSDDLDTENHYWNADGSWYDENEGYPDDPRLRVLSIPQPITLDQTLYQLLTLMIDNGYGDNNAFTLGAYSNSLPALGVLCDWQFMIDSGSSPVLTIWNYHPFYDMACWIEYNGFNAEVNIPCGDANSWDINGLMHDAYGDEYNASQFGAGATVNVYEIRWIY